MPFAGVKLIPGINVERTPTLLEAGYSQSALGRFKDGLFQKIGGWVKLYPNLIGGVARALHAWQDLNVVDRLLIGTTTQLSVLANGVLTPITPQILVSDFSPDFTTTMGSADVTVVDPNINGITVLDGVLFQTPVSVGGIILSGAYSITSIAGASSYIITATTQAASSVSNGGDVPVFDTTSGSAVVTVTLPDHGLAVGGRIEFPLATVVGGITVQGAYVVTDVGSADTFTITGDISATATATVSMNGGDAEIQYYINLGPAPGGSGYGVGPYGVGAYGSGATPTSQTGTPITATDWTEDNWGEIALACPRGGAIYYWTPSAGFVNAFSVTSGPPLNGGIFVAMPEQILVCWSSTVSLDIGVQQDPLLVRWSDSGNFLNFTVDATTQAGSFRIPTGSTIRGGLQGPQQALIWTDIDLWAMSYLGVPLVFGFNKVSGGSGLVGAHAMTELNGSVYWMGQSNFYVYGGGGAQTLPCPVWDYVFQDIDANNLDKCWAWSNTTFNEIWFFFPSASGGTGQCDKYVKFSPTEPGLPWDYGVMSRSSGIAQSVLGPPIASTPDSIIYQHELTNDGDGQAITTAMQTGYFVIGDGEQYAFVDWVLPDFKFGLYGGTPDASIQVTLYVVDYPGDTPRTYGPYTVTNTTPYFTPRVRGRQMALRVESGDLGSFWRLGLIRYRWAPDGRL